MRIVAVTNIKGGVGKITTAANLAYLAAAAGSPTVLWDLDPQGAACEMLLMHCPPGISLLPENVLRAKRAGARRRVTMEIVGFVMLGSTALWFSQQFDRHDW